jgi:hypothetical protein
MDAVGAPAADDEAGPETGQGTGHDGALSALALGAGITAQVAVAAAIIHGVSGPVPNRAVTTLFVAVAVAAGITLMISSGLLGDRHGPLMRGWGRPLGVAWLLMPAALLSVAPISAGGYIRDCGTLLGRQPSAHDDIPGFSARCTTAHHERWIWLTVALLAAAAAGYLWWRRRRTRTPSIPIAG